MIGDPRTDGQSLTLPKPGAMTRKKRRKLPRPKHPYYLCWAIFATAFAVFNWLQGYVFFTVYQTVWAAIYWRAWQRAEAGDPFHSEFVRLLGVPMILVGIAYIVATGGD